MNANEECVRVQDFQNPCDRVLNANAERMRSNANASKYVHAIMLVDDKVAIYIYIYSP
jgi:hypothetical protein